MKKYIESSYDDMPSTEDMSEAYYENIFRDNIDDETFRLFKQDLDRALEKSAYRYSLDERNVPEEGKMYKNEKGTIFNYLGEIECLGESKVYKFLNTSTGEEAVMDNHYFNKNLSELGISDIFKK